MSAKPTIRIGYVPEHYLTPLHLSLRLLNGSKHPLPFQISLAPFPSGTGHMITSLREKEIDLAIGLTEGWVAGLTGKQAQGQDAYKVVGRWVETPLRWAIVTGRNRGDVNGVEDLGKNGRVGISRVGSGSHIMSFVLAQQQSWQPDSLTAVPLGPFGSLRDGVTGNNNNNNSNNSNNSNNDQGTPTADFFMWEHFTTKPYFAPTQTQQQPPLKKIGEIFTPWPSWMIVASTSTFPDPSNDNTLRELFEVLDRGVREFEADTELPVRLLGTGELGCTYVEEDAREWLKGVRFVKGTRGVDRVEIERVVDVLKVAGVIDSGLGNDEAVRRVVGIQR